MKRSMFLLFSVITLLASIPPAFCRDFNRRVAPTIRSNIITREYSRQTTVKEKEDIRYIVTSLANSSWTTLLKLRSSLKRAGERVDHLHPFRFLMCIFKDEEMKAGVHSIRDKKKIWKGFTDGLYVTLDKEASRGNLKLDYIQDFADSFKLDFSLINKPIQEKQWEELVDILIQNLPREGDPSRYDM